MSPEIIRRRLAYIIPTAALCLALACPWLANAFRKSQHEQLVEQMLAKGCTVENVITTSIDPISGNITYSSSKDGAIKVEPAGGSAKLVRGTQTILNCPVIISDRGRASWTVFSSCLLLTDPGAIGRQALLSPTEPWRIAGCTTGLENE